MIKYKFVGGKYIQETNDHISKKQTDEIKDDTIYIKENGVNKSSKNEQVNYSINSDIDPLTDENDEQLESNYFISDSASLSPYSSPSDYITYRKGLIVISLILIIVLGLSMILPWYSQSTEFKIYKYNLNAEKSFSLN